MPNVCIPLATGFEELEAITLIDILRRGKIKVIVAGVNDKLVKGSHQITIQSDLLIDDVRAQELDMLLLPGGMQGTKELCTNLNVQNLIKDMNNAGKLIGAICAAPLALDKAGVLKKKFTCYPGLKNQFKSVGYVDNPNVIIDDNILTSKGPGTAMEFALVIVKLLMGDNAYAELKKDLLL